MKEMNEYIDDLYVSFIDNIEFLTPEPKKDYFTIFSSILKLEMHAQCLRQDLFSVRLQQNSREAVHFQGSHEDVKFLLRGKMKDAISEPTPENSKDLHDMYGVITEKDLSDASEFIGVKLTSSPNELEEWAKKFNKILRGH